MENVEIAKLLNKYADLLEIQGADLFRIQAYRNAGRTIESLSQSISQLVQEGKDLKKLKLPGIGKSMSEHLEEIAKTGSLGALNELRKKLPGSLDELLEIEGLGPKRTKLLYDKLGSTRSNSSGAPSNPTRLPACAGSVKKASRKFAGRFKIWQNTLSASNYWMPTNSSIL